MRPGIVVKGESGSEISLEVLDLLDISGQGSVNSLLDLSSLGSPVGLSLFQLLLPFSSGLWGVLEFTWSVLLVWLEPGIVDLANIDSSEVDLGTSFNTVGGVDSFQWDSVYWVWSWDKEISWGESFENDDSSSLVLAWEDDDNGSWSDFFLWRSGLVSFSLEVSFFVISWVPWVLIISDFSSLGSSMG